VLEGVVVFVHRGRREGVVVFGVLFLKVETAAKGAGWHWCGLRRW